MIQLDILLVEDNPADAELTIYALRQQRLANDIVWLQDGAEALDFLFCEGLYAGAEPRYPRVMLLDLKLPKVDGLEVLRRIKSDPRTRNVPVVVLTTSRDDRDLCASYNLGVNSYLQKPVDFDQFRTTVKQLGLYWLVVNLQPGTNHIAAVAAESDAEPVRG